MPPHAPCRLQRGRQGQSTLRRKLYLHTLRADCNDEKIAKLYKLGSFASTRSVQIATFAPCRTFVNFEELCLHTLRADCNVRRCDSRFLYLLCLHTLRADCNIVISICPPSSCLCLHTLRADCNYIFTAIRIGINLCLHTLRADCNGSRESVEQRRKDFASTRSVQIATAEMHRIAICTFQNVC